MSLDRIHCFLSSRDALYFHVNHARFQRRNLVVERQVRALSAHALQVPPQFGQLVKRVEVERHRRFHFFLVVVGLLAQSLVFFDKFVLLGLRFLQAAC